MYFINNLWNIHAQDQLININLRTYVIHWTWMLKIIYLERMRDLTDSIDKRFLKFSKESRIGALIEIQWVSTTGFSHNP